METRAIAAEAGGALYARPAPEPAPQPVKAEPVPEPAPVEAEAKPEPKIPKPEPRALSYRVFLDPDSLGLISEVIDTVTGRTMFFIPVSYVPPDRRIVGPKIGPEAGAEKKEVVA